MDESGALAVGIVGFGRIGAEHAGWLARAAGIRAVAADDPTPARLELARQRGLKTYRHVEDLLADQSIDVILVSTPTAMHHVDGLAALSAGKHVMIEKPMALDLAQASELIELAEKNQRVLSVFHNRRWDVDYLTVKQAIERGEFGKVINIESRIGQWASCVGPAAKEWHPTWRNEASYGGGGLYDWGSHFIDQLWRMMLPAPARPVRVFAQLRGNVWTNDCDDFARVCIDFDSGAVGMVEINTTTTRPLPRWHVDGTLGSADSPFNLEFDVERWAHLHFQPLKGHIRLLQRPDAAGLTETQMWEQFARAIRGQDEAAVTARSVIPTMALLDAARESSRAGRAIEISPEIFADQKR